MFVGGLSAALGVLQCGSTFVPFVMSLEENE
jgi:hypothetical protein